MGKKLAATKDGKHKIVKKVFITGEDLLHHKIKKIFRTTNGLHRIVYSSGVKWSKYDCRESTEVTGYKQVNSTSLWSVGDTDTRRYYRLNYCDGYYFSSAQGFVGTGYHVATDASEVPSSGYTVGDEIAWQMISCTPIDNGGSTIAEVTWECIGLCIADKETVYVQGETSYGTLEVEEGMLPEEGLLIEGSYAAGYCVRYLNDDYFYYVLEQ